MIAEWHWETNLNLQFQDIVGKRKSGTVWPITTKFVPAVSVAYWTIDTGKSLFNTNAYLLKLIVQ